jgi:tetratricopeptide (TPR) repeat protein
MMDSDDLIKRLAAKVPDNLFGKEINKEAFDCVNIADEYYKNDNFKEAIFYFSKAIELDSENHYSFYKRGKCYQFLKDYHRALSDLFHSQTIEDNFENNQAIGECYLYLQEHLKAIRFFDKALDLISELEKTDEDKVTGINYGATKARLFNNRAVCFYNAKNIAGAIESATNGIMSDYNYSNNYSIRGILRLATNAREVGIEDLKKAASMGNNNAIAALNNLDKF